MMHMLERFARLLPRIRRAAMLPAICAVLAAMNAQAIMSRGVV